MTVTNDLRTDQELFDLRPLVQLDNSSAKELEQFQNEVLRPIIKYQNDLLMRFFQSHPHAESILKHKSAAPEFRPKMHQWINQHENRNQIIGLVIALFTQKEFESYYPDRKAHNKRIVQMVEQRLCDNL